MDTYLEFAGTINSEETFSASLGDGRRLYVQMTAQSHQIYSHGVSEEQTLRVDFWLAYLCGRTRDCMDDAPTVWIIEEHMMSNEVPSGEYSEKQ
jgi:hypothetical protein